jgi:hypothetical protein
MKKDEVKERRRLEPPDDVAWRQSHEEDYVALWLTHRV